jgi:uncharacterized membrane protein YccC
MAALAGVAAFVWLGHQLGVEFVSAEAADFAIGLAAGMGLAALLWRLVDRTPSR